MGWAEAIKAALIAIPKLLEEFKVLRESVSAYAAARANEKLQEVRDAQNQLQVELMRITHDEERARMARRISELERRL